MPNNANIAEMPARPRIAFFDYPDVFEDFYPHYGVSQQAFGAEWQGTANHARIALLQQAVGDVIWYVTSIKPELNETQHRKTGCQVKFVPASWSHRRLWRWYYNSSISWRWQGSYRYFATLASYLAPLSLALLRQLRQDKPDYIFAQDYCSGRFDILLLFSKLLNIPMLTIHTGSTPDQYLGKWVKSYTIARANWIFASGNRELSRLNQAYGILPDRLNIIRSSVDLTIFKPLPKAEACVQAGLDPRFRYLLFMGRLDDGIKRVNAIIKAVGQLDAPDIRLLIAGTGNDEASLKSCAETHAPGKVCFLGWVSEPAQKAALYNLAECLVMASWREGFPAVVGEAFACGTPVAASDVGTISDVVTEGQTGWLFAAGDDAAMLKKLEFIAAHPETIQAMRPKIRAFAEENLSIEAVVQALKQGFSAAKNGKQ